MKVLVTRKKKGGLTQIRVAFQPVWLLVVTGIAPVYIFTDWFIWKYFPLKRWPPIRKVRGRKSKQSEGPHKS